MDGILIHVSSEIVFSLLKNRKRDISGLDARMN